MEKVAFHDSPQPVVFEEEDGKDLPEEYQVVDVACGMDHAIALVSE